jgi:hypothetical protein
MRGSKGNAIVTPKSPTTGFPSGWRRGAGLAFAMSLSGREQMDGIERRNNLTANDQFLQVAASSEGFVTKDLNPEIARGRNGFLAIERKSGIKHGYFLSNARATASPTLPQIENRKSKM